MEAFKTIKYYLTNGGKLFDFVVETLYFVSMLFIAGAIFGADLNIDKWSETMHTQLDVFFVQIIGLLITYLFVAMLLPLLATWLMKITVLFRLRVLYLVGGSKSAGVTFSFFRITRTNKQIVGAAIAERFLKLDDHTFAILKACVLNRKVTGHLTKAFIILGTYVFIKVCFHSQLGFSFMDWVIVPFLVLIPLHYSYCQPIEEALNEPEVFAAVEDQRMLVALRGKLRLNPYCTDVLPEELKATILKKNLFLIKKNVSAPVKGFVVIVTKPVADSWNQRNNEVWKMLQEPGTKIVFVDPRNYLRKDAGSGPDVVIIQDPADVDAEKMVINS